VTEFPSLAEVHSRADLRDALRRERRVGTVVDAWGGARAVLDRAFELMCGSAHPPERTSGVVEWRIRHADEQHTYRMAASSGTVCLESAEGKPRATISASLDSFLRIVAGDLNPLQGFLTRRLSVTGDLFFAKDVYDWFEGVE
jgi:predicted lipid carrier protein YhbT